MQFSAANIVGTELERLARKENSINMIVASLSEYNLGVRSKKRSFSDWEKLRKDESSPTRVF